LLGVDAVPVAAGSGTPRRDGHGDRPDFQRTARTAKAPALALVRPRQSDTHCGGAGPDSLACPAIRVPQRVCCVAIKRRSPSSSHFRDLRSGQARPRGVRIDDGIRILRATPPLSQAPGNVRSESSVNPFSRKDACAFASSIRNTTLRCGAPALEACAPFYPLPSLAYMVDCPRLIDRGRPNQK
jgi:hypothetical protein